MSILSEMRIFLSKREFDTIIRSKKIDELKDGKIFVRRFKKNE